MVIPNSYGMQVEATQQADQDRPQPSCWARKVARPPGLKWDDRQEPWRYSRIFCKHIKANKHGRAHSYTCMCAHHCTPLCRYEYEQHNLEYQTCNKRVAGGSWWVQQRIHGCMCPPSMLLSQFLRGHQMHTPNKYKHVGYNAWITWFVKCSKYQYEYVFLATQFLSG
jgi:hypothetical protein